MKTIKLFGVLILSVLLQGLFLIPKLIILLINFITSVLQIIKKTLTFLMEQIKQEVGL